MMAVMALSCYLAEAGGPSVTAVTQQIKPEIYPRGGRCGHDHSDLSPAQAILQAS